MSDDKLRAIRKVAIPAAGLALVALAALAVTVFAADPVDGKFSLFGGAQWVVGGLTPPGNKAVDLTSNCGAQPYSATCYTSTPPFLSSGLAFTLNSGHPATLSQITTLSTAYNMNGTDCSGGSPRWVIFTNSHNFEVNFGKAPFGGDCYYGWQNTGNDTNTPDPTLRWQVDVGNTFFSWSDILASHGTEQVTEIDIVLDAGWIALRGQDVTIDGFTVNNNVMHP